MNIITYIVLKVSYRHRHLSLKEFGQGPNIHRAPLFHASLSQFKEGLILGLCFPLYAPGDAGNCQAEAM